MKQQESGANPHRTCRTSGGQTIDLDALTSGLVHELRNPLASILTAVTLVQDDPGITGETSMLLGIVKKEAQRLNKILTEFSSYMKLPPPRPATVDVVEELRQVLLHLKRDEIIGGTLVIDDALPARLLARVDEAHLQRALESIIRNAVEALQGSGVVRIHSNSESGADAMVSLCVEDNGPGFTGEALQRALLPFYSTKPDSIGLGLPQAVAVAEMAGGELSLANLMPHAGSAGAAGACVCLRLPAARSSSRMHA